MIAKLFKLWLSLLMLGGLSRLTHAAPIEGQVERVDELGFGFRRVMLALPVNTDFESTGHFEFLYYRDQRLAQVGGPWGSCLVSPSGNFVVFQDGPSGNVVLYRRLDGQRFELTKHFIAVVRSFEWHEKAGIVDVYFETGASDSYLAPPPESETLWDSKSRRAEDARPGGL